MFRVPDLHRLFVEDSGQDLIEYALLSASIGLAGIAVFSIMGDTMQSAYSFWVTSADSAADMPPPVPATP